MIYVFISGRPVERLYYSCTLETIWITSHSIIIIMLPTFMTVNRKACVFLPNPALTTDTKNTSKYTSNFLRNIKTNQHSYAIIIRHITILYENDVGTEVIIPIFNKYEKMWQVAASNMLNKDRRTTELIQDAVFRRLSVTCANDLRPRFIEIKCQNYA